MHDRLRGADTRAGFAKGSDDFGEPGFDVRAPRVVAQQVERCFRDRISSGSILNEFGKNLLIRQEVGHGSVPYFGNRFRDHEVEP